MILNLEGTIKTLWNHEMCRLVVDSFCLERNFFKLSTSTSFVVYVENSKYLLSGI